MNKQPRIPTFEILAPYPEAALENGWTVTGLNATPTRIVSPDGRVCIFGALAVYGKGRFADWTDQEIKMVGVPRSPVEARRELCERFRLDRELMVDVECGFEFGVVHSIFHPTNAMRVLGAKLRAHFDSGVLY